MEKTKQIDLGKTQQEINNLLEKRLALLRELAIAENKKDSYNSQIKELKKDMDGIDKLSQDKLDELNKYRGIAAPKK